MKYKLVDTDQIFVDSTHVKACANSKKMRKRVAHEQAFWYEDELKKELDRLNQEKNKLLKDIENQEFSKIKAEGYLDDEYGFAFCCNLLYKFSGNDTENFEIYKLSKKTKKG